MSEALIMIRAETHEQYSLAIEQVTDPSEIERFRVQTECHRRNSKWLQAHWSDLIPQARGKFLAVANEEPFLAGSPKEAWEWVSACHSEDKGAIVRYIPAELGPRIYANLG
jgi:hypothetical protein